jgi:hypothetical protein
MKKMDQDKTVPALQSAIRSLVIAISGALVARGVISGDDATIAVSFLPVIAMAAWGVWTAWKKEEKAQQRELDALKAGFKAGLQTPDESPVLPKKEGE